MQKTNFSATIAIDTARSAFHFYSMIGGDKTTISHQVKHYAGGQFDADFFTRFKAAVRDFAHQTPSEAVRKVTVVLPDNAVMMDTVRIPTIKKSSQMNKALDTALRGLFRNYDDLHVIAYVADQNKQYTAYSIAAVQKHIVTSIYAACSENKLLVDTLTFASSASIGTATMLHPKLKMASYVFLDVKDVYSRFVFVANGRAVGYYTLPFGLEFLRNPKVISEDMLFDHSYAELAVLNAKEKAKSKKLTVMNSDGGAMYDAVAAEAETEKAAEKSEAEDTDAEDVEDIDDAEEQEEIEEPVPVSMPMQVNQKIFVKKSPRRLPKFMQREIPDTEEGIAYENFRVFVKWALTLMKGNERLVELGKPEFVCVNLPKDLAHLIDKVNVEANENGISFNRLPTIGEKSIVISNLELYGGLFPGQIASTGKF